MISSYILRILQSSQYTVSIFAFDSYLLEYRSIKIHKKALLHFYYFWSYSLCRSSFLSCHKNFTISHRTGVLLTLKYLSFCVKSHYFAFFFFAFIFERYFADYRILDYKICPLTLSIKRYYSVIFCIAQILQTFLFFASEGNVFFLWLYLEFFFSLSFSSLL